MCECLVTALTDLHFLDELFIQGFESLGVNGCGVAVQTFL